MLSPPVLCAAPSPFILHLCCSPPVPPLREEEPATGQWEELYVVSGLDVNWNIMQIVYVCRVVIAISCWLAASLCSKPLTLITSPLQQP